MCGQSSIYFGIFINIFWVIEIDERVTECLSENEPDDSGQKNANAKRDPVRRDCFRGTRGFSHQRRLWNGTSIAAALCSNVPLIEWRDVQGKRFTDRQLISVSWCRPLGSD